MMMMRHRESMDKGKKAICVVLSLLLVIIVSEHPSDCVSRIQSQRYLFVVTITPRKNREYSTVQVLFTVCKTGDTQIPVRKTKV